MYRVLAPCATGASGQKMASCLLECLCEAELEQYYPQFLAVGLQKVEELAAVTMKDYSKLGVHCMEDRKRLFQLIKIIQTVASEDDDRRTPLQPGCVYLQPPHNRSATRRQLQFNFSYDSAGDGLSSPAGRLQRPAEIGHRAQKVSTTGGEERSCSSADVSCFEGLKSTASGLMGSDGPIIHRVVHVSGYNYGVPQTHLRPSATDKEEPWTDGDKIRVCVRKRPLGLREERRGEMSVVTVEDGKTVMIHERKEAVNLKEYILQHVFYFDEVFSEAFTNQDVYTKTAYPLIQHVFNGENAACFAYGQTGAGKTYTMIGTQRNPGLYALAARDLFQQLECSQPRKDHSVWISFFEIYCGQLYDLLNGRKRLYAREDGKHVVQVVGLREVQVKSVDYLLEMILKGSRERSTGATGVNSDSSRSHAVIQIQIKDARNRKLGRMSFIDLAGSERASDARQSDKQTKMEGAEINQSLLALKECIRALDQEQAHTPFRQSKLTQVLKDSFIGNSKTCMIANISPSHIATEHTLNTLRYADRVKDLKKGMRCTTSSANRSRSAMCLSPKRVQNSSSTLGEKISPKKVKLGSPQSSTPHTTKPKSYPSVFHPSNIPLSSTPKSCTKPNTARGAPSQSWLAHTTPVKGVIRTGGNCKKKTETNQEKNPTPRVPSGNKQEMTDELKENYFIHNRPTPQKVQPVQPVQKQIVTKTGMSFGDNTRARDSGGSSDSRVLPEQKEREEHLKYYHQQFQQPPILHQKLHYQPLEKILDQYKPQEVTYGRMSSSTSRREGQTVEDPDDSDFSEDSFSYASNQKKGRKEEMVRERLSFFLHQSSPSVETRNFFGRDEGLSFNYSESKECKTTLGPRSATGCGVVEPKRTERGDHTLWSSEDDSTSAQCSSDIIHTPEKPYSPQEDIPNQLKKKQDPYFRHKMLEVEGVDFSPLKEKVGRTLPLDGTQATSATLNNENSSDSINKSSASGSMAPLTVSLLQDNWSLECTHDLGLQDSLKSDAGGGNVTCFDKDLTVESQADDHSVEHNLSALIKQMLRYKDSLHSPNAQQREKDFLLEVGYESQPCSPQFLVQQSMCDQSASPRSASMADTSFDQVSHYYADNEESNVNPRNYEFATVPWILSRKTPDGTAEVVNEQDDNKVVNKSQEKAFKMIPTIQSKFNSPPIENDDCPKETSVEPDHAIKLPFTDRDLEQLKSKLLNCLFAHRGVKEDKMPRYALTRDKRGPRTKATLTSQLQAVNVNGQQEITLEKAQQLIVQAHCKQLKDVSALCLEEETLLNRASHADFLEYVKKLDEILRIKCKLIDSLRAALQLFLDYSSQELTASAAPDTSQPPKPKTLDPERV